jgi:threonine dehydrogenase-like Zn-dependent dehydrogenase
MDKQSLAAVIVDKRRLEMREFPVPGPRADDAVLRVEACGICGSDYHYYKELDHWPYLNPPHIMGHEVVGRIAAIGADAARNWKLKEGDLVAVEAPVTCQRCRYCLTGNATLCADKRSYGISASMADPPHLWGGYAQYMYLHPNSILHPVPPGVSPPAAVLYTCISNGVKWAQRVPALSPGDSIVILGPGQQGLGCVLAAAIAGASPIIVAGLAADAKRLSVAKELGATHLIYSERAPLVEQVKGILGSELADIVVDVTGSSAAQQAAVDLVRRGGTVVLAGRTPNETVEFEMDKIASRGINMIGVRGHESDDIRRALNIVAARPEAAAKLTTHELPLKDADYALRLIGQEVPGENAIHVSLNPWLS